MLKKNAFFDSYNTNEIQFFQIFFLNRRWRINENNWNFTNRIKIMNANISFRRIWFFCFKSNRKFSNFKKLWIIAFLSFDTTIMTRDRIRFAKIDVDFILIHEIKWRTTFFRLSKSFAKIQITSLNKKIKRTCM